MKKHTLSTIFIITLILAACQPATPVPATATPTPVPPTTAPPTLTATPEPQDVPVYRNSFEGISDLAASGITSGTASVTTNTENFNYPGPGTALEVKGILAGEAYSGLDVDFSIASLTGETSLDLSNKTLGISFLVPPGSPIDGVDIIIHRDDKIVILGAASGTGWIDYQLDVKAVYENKSWVFTNAPDDEALDMIKHCTKITLTGARSTAGTQAETAFYLDDLNWIGIDINHIPVDNTIDSLRKYATDQHFKLGLVSNRDRVFGTEYVKPDPWNAYEVVQEGNLIARGGTWPEDNEDRSNFDYIPNTWDDVLINIINFSNSNSLNTMGYTLIDWYPINQAGWWDNLSYPDGARDLLLFHVEKDLRATQGQHPIWLMFNELVQGYNGAIPNAMYNWTIGLKNRENTGPVESDCCYSPWSADIHDSALIQEAINKAHEVDPDATLMFNDIYNEAMGWPLAEFYYQFTADLKAQGVPINGVGFEMHNSITPDGRMMFWILSPEPYEYVYMDLDDYLQKVDANVKRYAKAGMKVGFTEVDGNIKIDDIDFNTAEGRAEYESRMQWQAKYYAGLLKIAIENDNVVVFNMWEWTEKYPAENSLYPGYSNSGILDKNYHPKPAYEAMLELLKNR
jgi:GH35 family endo-1,4-beta-xylanase